MTFIILIGRQNHRVKKGLYICMSFLCLNSRKMNNQTIYVKMSPENLSVCEEPVILRIMDGDINVEILRTSTRQQTWRALTRLGGHTALCTLLSTAQARLGLRDTQTNKFYRLTQCTGDPKRVR